MLSYACMRIIFRFSISGNIIHTHTHNHTRTHTHANTYISICVTKLFSFLNRFSYMWIRKKKYLSERRHLIFETSTL